MSFKSRTSKTSKLAVIAMMFANIFMYCSHMGLQSRMGCASVFTRLALISFVDCSVNISHMRHQFGSIGERFSAHRTLASGQRAAFLGMTLHVSIDAHLSSSLKFAKTALELFDGDFVYATNMLFKKSAMFSHMTALATLITRLGLQKISMLIDEF